MALSTIDPKTTLIVIDLQKGIVSFPAVHPVAEVVKKARDLADAFRSHRPPVLLVNVAGRAPGRTEQARGSGDFHAGWTDLITELNQQPTDHTITKHTPQCRSWWRPSWVRLSLVRSCSSPPGDGSFWSTCLSTL